MEFIPYTSLPACLSLYCVMLISRVPSTDSKLYKDASFPATTKILGRNISCGPHIIQEFAGPTWTCTDLRVDRIRLAYGYHPQMSASGFCTDTEGRDNLGAICRELLWSNKITKKFWSATVSEATCEETREKRAIMVENDRTFYWEDFKPGRGWLITIHCTTLPNN